jgi:hypothetical protein
MSGSAPRRDNGLTATSYVRLDDVETHLVDELLDRLAQNGVAAYSAPSVGRRGPYGDTVPPLGPSDSVYVDTEQRERARAVTDTYLREFQDELAWSDIVAGFDTEPDSSEGGVPRWPVSEDIDLEDIDPEDRTASATTTDTLGTTIGFEELRANTPTSPVVRRDAAADDPEDHFQPPPPPPLPEIDRVGRFAWAGALGGPAFLVLATLLGLHLDGWVGFLALVGFMAGFVTLVARMKDRPPGGTGPDDGAVV